MNDNEKPFITDDIDMLGTMIWCGILLLIGLAFAGFVIYEIGNVAEFLLHWILPTE